jgi:DNA-binding protein H-NS
MKKPVDNLDESTFNLRKLYPMSTDLRSLSLDELSELVASAQKALLERKKSHQKEVIRNIQSLANSIGLSVTLHPVEQTVSRGVTKGSKAPIRYRNPRDPNQTWSGRGLQPRWLQAEIQEGHPLESFRV